MKYQDVNAVQLNVRAHFPFSYGKRTEKEGNYANK